MPVSIISFYTLHRLQLMEWQVVLVLHSVDAAWFYYIIFSPSSSFITYQGLKSLINRKLKEGKKNPSTQS